MTQRYNGGVVGKANAPTPSVASGVWDLRSHGVWRRQNLWPAQGDLYWANVVALLHFDGADGSTTFTDEVGHTFTAAGNAQIDTGQSKWGGASALFDGSGDRVTSSDHADWDLGSSDFCIEFWVRAASTSGVSDLVGKRPASAVGPYLVYRNGTSLAFYASSNGSTWNIASGGGFGTIAANTWYHVAVVRNGNSFTGYLDGVGTAIATSSSAILDDSSALCIGGSSTGTEDFNGWIDDLRITKGVPRYTANFTPPAAAFPGY